MSVIQDDYVKCTEAIRGLPKKKNGFRADNPAAGATQPDRTASRRGAAERQPHAPASAEAIHPGGSGSSTSPGVKTRLRHRPGNAKLLVKRWKG